MAFFKKIESLLKNKPLPSRSILLPLRPIMDQNELLRVSGRINNSLFSDDRRHPIILSSRCSLIKLIIINIHENYFHDNKEFVKAFLMSKYWIVGGMNRFLIKSVIRKCVICAKYFARPNTELMSDLPLSRTTPSRPFYCNRCGFLWTICYEICPPSFNYTVQIVFMHFRLFIYKSCALGIVFRLERREVFGILSSFF